MIRRSDTCIRHRFNVRNRLLFKKDCIQEFKPSHFRLPETT
ncbi:hypothetical protein ACKLNO_07425 [Neisseriaceae bacterium B1]